MCKSKTNQNTSHIVSSKIILIKLVNNKNKKIMRNSSLTIIFTHIIISKFYFLVVIHVNKAKQNLKKNIAQKFF